MSDAQKHAEIHDSACRPLLIGRFSGADTHAEVHDSAMRPLCERELTMGFRPKNRTYRLMWEAGHDLHGFDVTARALRLGELLKLGAMAESAKDNASDITDLVKTFADVLVEWNREDAAGAPVPANADGLMQLEDWEFYGLLDAYISAGIGVSDPLANGSPNGGQSPVVLPPMDDL